MITQTNITAGYENEEWLGFGYLGERQRDTTPEQVAKADAKALAAANERGLTPAQFFDWANSKVGRWYGDCMFGSAGKHADKYLPQTF